MGGRTTVKLSPHEMAWCLKQVGFTGIDQLTGLDNIVLGVAIGLAESAGETDAMGVSTSGSSIGNRDHGIWQISGKFHGDKITKTPDWRDPLVNAKLAKAVFDEAIRAGRTSGWQPWSTYKVDAATGKASYMAHLSAANIAVTAMWRTAYPAWLLQLTHDRVASTQQLADELPDLSEIKAMITGLAITKTETISLG